MDPIAIISNEQRYGTTQQASGSAATTAGQGTAPDQPASAANGQGLQLPEDRVTLSGRKPEQREDGEDKGAKTAGKTTPDGKSAEDPEVQQAVERLKRIEEKVKAHEAAHKAAGGNLAGSASYSYTQGPDGRSYVTGGEVQIDMSGGNTPEETIARMQQVIRAALAPADPSGQDRAVAAQAASAMAQAQQEKFQAANLTSESEPGQSVDPAAEALKKALDPESEDSRSPVSSASDSRIQQAYGDTAVQGTGRSNTSATPFAPATRGTGQNPGTSRDSENPLFSSFA